MSKRIYRTQPKEPESEHQEPSEQQAGDYTAVRGREGVSGRKGRLNKQLQQSSLVPTAERKQWICQTQEKRRKVQNQPEVSGKGSGNLLRMEMLGNQ